MATLTAILNNVWDRVNSRLMSDAWAGSALTYMETESTIFNNVWDAANNRLRISGGAVSGGATNLTGIVYGDGAALSAVANVAVGQVLVSSTPPVWSDRLGLGTATPGVGTRLYLLESRNGSSGLLTENPNTGSNAHVLWQLKNDAGRFASLFLMGNNNVGEAGASSLNIRTEASGGNLFLSAGGGSSPAGFTITPVRNYGFGTATFGTSAAGVVAIFLGTEPTTSPADTVQLYAVDLSAGNNTLGLRTERAVAVDAAVASTHSLSIRINGTTYRLLLAT